MILIIIFFLLLFEIFQIDLNVTNYWPKIIDIELRAFIYLIYVIVKKIFTEKLLTLNYY